MLPRSGVDSIARTPRLTPGDVRKENMAESVGRIEVLNGCRWMGDPWLGRVHVYVDGVKIGVAPVFRCLQSKVSPGSHSVRIRLWWMKSKPVTIEVNPGDSVRLEGCASVLGSRFGHALRRGVALRPA
jgi:hypothetical protein